MNAYLCLSVFICGFIRLRFEGALVICCPLWATVNVLLFYKPAQTPEVTQHFLVGEVRVAAAGIGKNEYTNTVDHLRLEPAPDRFTALKELAEDHHAHRRDQFGTKLPDLQKQGSPARGEIARPQVVGPCRRTRHQIREAPAVSRQVTIVPVA